MYIACTKTLKHYFSHAVRHHAQQCHNAEFARELAQLRGRARFGAAPLGPPGLEEDKRLRCGVHCLFLRTLEAYARLTVANSVIAFWPCDSAARAASPKGRLKPEASEEDSWVVNMPSPVHRTPRH